MHSTILLMAHRICELFVKETWDLKSIFEWAKRGQHTVTVHQAAIGTITVLLLREKSKRGASNILYQLNDVVRSPRDKAERGHSGHSYFLGLHSTHSTYYATVSHFFCC